MLHAPRAACWAQQQSVAMIEGGTRRMQCVSCMPVPTSTSPVTSTRTSTMGSSATAGCGGGGLRLRGLGGGGLCLGLGGGGLRLGLGGGGRCLGLGEGGLLRRAGEGAATAVRCSTAPAQRAVDGWVRTQRMRAEQPQDYPTSLPSVHAVHSLYASSRVRERVRAGGLGALGRQACKGWTH